MLRLSDYIIVYHMSKSFKIPRGTADILPSEVISWQRIEQQARAVFKAYNYKEIRTPVFEETELFARSMGQTSDVVQKQMFNLAAQTRDAKEGLEQTALSLRPENTASVIRSYIENHFDKKEGVSKFYYIGPMFRGERPQKGRLRQFHQIGVEAIGPKATSPYLDAEVIALGVHLLNAFGIKGFKLTLNTLGSQQDKEKLSQHLRQKLSKKISDLCPDCQNRLERNVFRVLDCKNKGCRDVVRDLELDYSYLSKESQKHYSAVKKALEDLNIEFEESHSLVRGLDYYTHTVFEISHSSLGSQDALGAGGRYNDLAEQLGGPSVAATGFSFGVERIGLVLPEECKTATESLDVFVIPLDEVSCQKAFQLTDLLRKAGFLSEINYDPEISLKGQMRLANKVGSQHVVILGENELKQECVTLKYMDSGEQQEVSVSLDKEKVSLNDIQGIIDILTKKKD